VERFRKLQDRLPQMGVVGNHDPRRRCAEFMHQPQRAVDILEHADGVGDHDIIEGTLDPLQRRRILHIAQHEIQLGVTGVGLGDGLGAKIDADAVRRPQRGEQIPAAAAQFQDPLARRNQESHEFLIVFVVGGVEFAPAIQFVAIGLEMVEQIPLALAGKLQ
jgi:hypothetical protein